MTAAAFASLFHPPCNRTQKKPTSWPHTVVPSPSPRYTWVLSWHRWRSASSASHCRRSRQTCTGAWPIAMDARGAGWAASQAGWRMAPVFLAMLIVSPLFGRLAARYGMRAVMSVGYLLLGLAMLSMALFTPATPYGAVAACFALLGVALGLAVPATGAAMMASAPRERSGAASATMNALRQGGMVIGIALLGSITNAAAVSAWAQTFTKAGPMRPPHWRQWPCSEGRCPSRWLWRRSCYSWRGEAAPDLTRSACFPAACETTNGSNSQAL